jgi:hypothetical protein
MIRHPELLDLVGEGANGAVFQIRTTIETELPTGVREVEEKVGPVGKLLKIQTSGDALKEFTWQKRAYDVLEQAKRDNPTVNYAEIPRVFYSADVPLDDDMRAGLKSLPIKGLYVQNEIGALLMEKVEGADIVTLAYRKALEVEKVKLNGKNLSELSAKEAQL